MKFDLELLKNKSFIIGCIAFLGAGTGLFFPGFIKYLFFLAIVGGAGMILYGAVENKKINM